MLVGSILSLMYAIDLHMKMYSMKDEFIPSLSIKEIFDFCSTEFDDQPLIDEQFKHKEATAGAEKAKEKLHFVAYTTKKDINQAIKNLNQHINYWMEQRRKQNPFAEFHIEELVETKTKLQKRLSIIGSLKLSELEDRKSLAKQAPIDLFLEFKGGFTKCLWHDEKTASLKYFPNENMVWCFAGCGRHDVIDCYMKKFNVDFNTAIRNLIKWTK